MSIVELKNLRKLIIRILILLSPFATLQFAELFILPIDFFSFRVWESALAIPYRYPGPFYPNLEVIKMKEYGDRYRSGLPDSFKYKKIEWSVDKFGWRNRSEIESSNKYNVVVLGDSNIVGSYLTQKDILSEVLMQRGAGIVYSYSYGSDHIGLFFSDQRLIQKKPELLVVESKPGNWYTTGDYLKNFYLNENGNLNIIARDSEFKKNDESDRNISIKIFKSRFDKHAMFHWLRSTLAVNFESQLIRQEPIIKGIKKNFLKSPESWTSNGWTINNGISRPLWDLESNNIGFELRSIGGDNCYWHTEKFFSNQNNGKIRVRFEARSTISISKHRMWIFEDGVYRTLGEFLSDRDWRLFEFDVPTKLGSALEFQIDQPNSWEWLAIRNFEIINAKKPQKNGDEIQKFPYLGTTEIKHCEAKNKNYCDSLLTGSNGGINFVQTIDLPPIANNEMIIRFEALTDQNSQNHFPVYLVDKDKDINIGNLAYSSKWTEYELNVNRDSNVPFKIRLIYPYKNKIFKIKNFRIYIIEKHNPVKISSNTLSTSNSINNNLVGNIFKNPDSNFFPKPINLPPLDGPIVELSPEASRYYFYHAVRAIKRRANEMNMEFIMFVMPDGHIGRLLPVLRQLRKEGIKLIYYEPSAEYPIGVREDWYWHKADSHWTEGAVRLTSDEILRLWKSKEYMPRKFNLEMSLDYD